MLNYIWLTLLTLGILIALGGDIGDELNENYSGDKVFKTEIVKRGDKFFFKTENFVLPIENFTPEKNARFVAKISDDAPAKAKALAEENGDSEKITFVSDAAVAVNDSVYSAEVTIERAHFPKMKAVTAAVLDYAKTSVNIAIGLIGIMAFWLGLMRVAEKAGLVKSIAKSVKPVMRKLFPDVPPEHPAIAAMIMNISANMLGLGNAATPFGLKAMEELDKLNPEKGTATDAMCTFLAINTAGLTLIPATAIAIRAAQGSSDPTVIIGTSFFGALAATFTGISVAKLFEFFSKRKSVKRKLNAKIVLKITAGVFVFILAAIGIVKFMFLSEFSSYVISVIRVISVLAIPLIILIFLLYGFKKKVDLYAEFTEGAKEGFAIAVKIIPYLVAMLVAIGVFRASGGMDFLVSVLSPATNLIGMPAEVLPMALMRPLSGSGSIGIMTELMAQHGPDSFIGVLASTILGSTETTFYVLALYFGSVNIRKTRHAVIAGVSADVAGILAALFIVRLLFGM